MKPKPLTYTIREAAAQCGFSRANTFREKFLRTPEEREAFGAHYDERGRLVLDRSAVEAAGRRVRAEREKRGNWRARNLGDYARPRRRSDESSSSDGSRT